MNFKQCTFLLLSFIFCVFICGLTQNEKVLTVWTNSNSYQKQNINIDSITDGQITGEMFYSLPSQEDRPKVKLIWTDSNIYAFESCRFNVWKWTDNRWDNLYRGKNKGWCISNYFFVKNEIFGFTGKGFWTSQCGLYQFSENTGHWNIISTDHTPEQFYSESSFRIGQDTIISLSGTRVINGLSEYLPILSSHAISINSNSWFDVTFETTQIPILSSIKTGTVFDFKETALIRSGEFNIQIDKKKNQLYFETVKKSELLNSFDLIYNDNEKAIVINDGRIFHIGPKPLHQLKRIGSFIIHDNEKKTANDSIEKEKKSSKLVSFSLIIISLVLILFLIKVVRREKEESVAFRKLKPFFGNTLSSDQLDDILGINSQLNYDSSRAKRSKIIRDLNKESKELYGKELISRVRNEEDSRFINYEIKK